MEPKKIDFVIGGLKRGGAEHVISVLANHFVSLGYDTNVLLLLNGGVEYRLDPRVNVIHMHRETKSRVANVRYWVYSLRNHFASRRPDYVVSFVCRINLLTIAALKKCRKACKPRLILSERNDPRFDGRGIASKALVPLLYPYADAIVFQSETVKNLFGKSIRDKGTIILNPIDKIASPVECAQRKRVIVTAGRLSPQKNHALLLRAFASMRSLVPDSADYVLHLYGSGMLKPDLTRLASELGINDSVSFFENIPNVQEKVAESRFFVMSSLFEGLSNALMEAVALGVPSISTPTAGADSVIVPGKNGFITNDFSTESLAQALTRAVSMSEEEYAAMSKACLEVAKTFETQKILAQYYETIVG